MDYNTDKLCDILDNVYYFIADNFEFNHELDEEAKALCKEKLGWEYPDIDAVDIDTLDIKLTIDDIVHAIALIILSKDKAKE